MHDTITPDNTAVPELQDPILTSVRVDYYNSLLRERNILAAMFAKASAIAGYPVNSVEDGDVTVVYVKLPTGWVNFAIGGQDSYLVEFVPQAEQVPGLIDPKDRAGRIEAFLGDDF